MTERKYTLKTDPDDSRDFLFVAPQMTFPESVDLRNKMSPIVNQGDLGSCTANAIASGLREYWMIASGQPLTPLSRLYLYWHERDLEGTVNTDSGAFIRDGMKVLQTLGCAPESLYPYITDIFANKPTAEAEQAAGAFKVAEYHRVTDLDALKSALALGQPVVIGIQVYESFESQSAADTGIIPMPNTTTEKLLGGHALLAAGYDDVKQVVIVRNSWGEGWGDKGYCYIPYSFFQFPLVNDMWTATMATPVKPEDISFHQAIVQMVKEKHFVDPAFWDGYEARVKSGTVTPADAAVVIYAFKKIAADDMNLGM